MAIEKEDISTFPTTQAFR